MTFLSESAWNPEQLLSIVPAIVFETRLNFRDGKFILGYVNQTAAELLGFDPSNFDPADFSLEDFMRLVHPGDTAHLNVAIAEATAKVGRFHEQCRLMLPDGMVRWIDMVADPEP